MSDDPATEIKDFINRRLLPTIEEMKSNHEDKSRLFFVSAVTSTVILLATLGGAGWALEIDDFAAVEFGVAVGVIVFYGLALHGIFHFVFVRGVHEEYTDAVVAPLVDQLRPGIDYWADEEFSQRDFEQSAIAQLPLDDFESRDIFETALGDVDLRFSEIAASTRVRKEDQQFAMKRTCFWLRGLLFEATLPRSFDTTIVVIPTLRLFSNADELPKIEASRLDENPTVRPAAGWPHLDWRPENHGEPAGEVTVPDPEFHHLFDAYSTDIAEARSLLRPLFTKRLKEVYSVWKSDVHRTPLTRLPGQGHFILVIRDDRLYVGRPMPRKIGEIRAFDARQQTELLVQMARDIQLSIDLIDTFRQVALFDGDEETQSPTVNP